MEDHGSALARMAAQQDNSGRLRPGDRQRARIVKDGRSIEKISARIVHRRAYLENVLEHPDLVRGGLLSEMLSPESDIAGTPAIGELKYVQTRYLREGNYIKRKVGRKKELKSKFKNAARAAAFGFIAGGGSKVKKMQFDDETFDPAPKVEEVEVFEDVPELTSRERAMVFFNRTQRMSMQSTESPAIRLLLEKRKLDEATATTQMRKTNDHTRMVGLQNRKNLDKIEREVLARLEAKHHGLIFVAERNRKEKERRDKFAARRDRIKEIERKDAEMKTKERLLRQEKLRRLTKPFRAAARRASQVAHDGARRASQLGGVRKDVAPGSGVPLIAGLKEKKKGFRLGDVSPSKLVKAASRGFFASTSNLFAEPESPKTPTTPKSPLSPLFQSAGSVKNLLRGFRRETAVTPESAAGSRPQSPLPEPPPDAAGAVDAALASLEGSFEATAAFNDDGSLTAVRDDDSTVRTRPFDDGSLSGGSLASEGSGPSHGAYRDDASLTSEVSALRTGLDDGSLAGSLEDSSLVGAFNDGGSLVGSLDDDGSLASMPPLGGGEWDDGSVHVEDYDDG